tara:strand:- start:1110 stop:1616 length:507 start_codon:yes stop_codon:yes gene_type:complete
MVASIEVSPENDLSKISELAGVVDKNGFYYEDGSLCVLDISQETLDSAFVAYNDNLEIYLIQPLRQVRKDELARQAHHYIELIYPSYRRELFIALAEEARNLGLTNRSAYIDQMLAWVKTVVSAVLLAEDAVDSYDTVEEIKSTSLNIEVFSATDPEITIRGAMAIED